MDKKTIGRVFLSVSWSLTQANAHQYNSSAPVNSITTFVLKNHKNYTTNKLLTNFKRSGIHTVKAAGSVNPQILHNA